MTIHHIQNGPSTAYGAALDALRRRLRFQAQWLRALWEQPPSTSRQSVVTDLEVDLILSGPAPSWMATDALPDEEWEGPSPLADLADRFALSRLEVWALFTAFAPDLDPDLLRAYAYAQDVASRTYPTPTLVLLLFPDLWEEREGALRSFLPTAPLTRWRLLSDETARSTAPLSLRPLSVDDRIRSFLLGDPAPDLRIAPLLHPVTNQRPAPSQKPLITRVASLMAEDTVNLIGSEGAGLKGLAAGACALAGQRLLRTSLAEIASAEDPRETTLLIAREVRLQEAALLVEADGSRETGMLRPLLNAGFPCLVASPEQLAGTPVFVDPIPRHEQVALWKAALGRVPEGNQVPEQFLETLVEHFGLAPDAIPEAATTTDPSTLWKLARERGRRALNGLAQRVHANTTWSDLVLSHDVERQLREIAAQCRHRFHVHERWGFGARLHRGRGITALFSGPSGCGKTTAAEVLATELQLDLYRIDLAGIVNKYIGETEKNLRRIFDAAEQAGAILLFDEADALFGKRTEVSDAHDRYANIEIDYLLQRMEGYRGLAILATNMRQSMDHAFLRRLRFLVEFDFPGDEQRLRLWQRAFPPSTPIGELDLPFLARLELSGGNIATVAVNAAFLAAEEGVAIGMGHVLRAVRRECAKLNRFVQAADFGPYAHLVKP